MAQNITLLGASYSDVPAVTLPKTSGGTAKFTDVTDTTATVNTVLNGSVFFDSDGTERTGTVTFVTVYSGSSVPSSSLGNNGDIYIQK